MDFNSALDIIIKDLGEARSIIDDFRKYKEVPLIQIELAKAKCRSAAEIIALLKDMPVKEEEPPAPAAVITVVADKVVTVKKPKLIAEAPEAAIQQPLDEPVAKAVVPAAGKEIFADRFKDVPGRVSEKVKALNPDADLTSRMQQSPIVNLADAVGVNDKFYFIREVFGGDSHSYHEALTKLNSASGLKEAREILENYAGNTGNREAMNDLLALVKRKTGDNE